MNIIKVLYSTTVLKGLKFHHIHKVNLIYLNSVKNSEGFVNQTFLTEKKIEYIKSLSDVYNIWKCLGSQVYKWEPTNIIQIFP